ncbi:MAG: helix-turn-helix domain-containing protein [Dorea sp.]|nr:helix-turn-helix domain-containing protein [Dorea sp.]
MSTPFALDRKQIAWAFDKWNLGYTLDEIADALFVNRRTLERAFNRTYGKNRIRIKPILVYEDFVGGGSEK